MSAKLHMHRLLAVAGLVLLTACAPPDSPADAASKAALRGDWAYDSTDASGQRIEGRLRLGPTGLFSGTERVTGAADDEYSGEWFVTEGLFKLKTTRSGGQRLGTFQMGFFTCSLHDVGPQAFACTDRVATRTYRFRRVPG